MEHAETARLEDWPLRPWLLAALLGIAALVVNAAMEWDAAEQEPSRAALAAFAFFGSLVLAVTLEEDRWKAPLAFAGLAGLVMAGIAWRVASAGDRYADEEFWMAAGVVATGLALPLFQAGFHRLRWRTSYRDTHYHVWTDAISAAGSFAFLGLSWLLLVLLSELFAAIKITFLRELMDEEWFGWLFSGVAFGAALGTLRNQLKVIGTLQSVVLLVFSLIAVPFALALTVFLVAVLLSGIDVLWDATQSPTPLLLACAAACFVLVNSVARDSDAEASGNRVLRIAGLLLALGILPLAVMAAISTGTRIGQYGLSPERIWRLIAVAVAVAYGVAYFAAPVRGRVNGWVAGWMQGVRGANMHLAVGTCVLTFLLALPLFDFGAISARDQVARLAGGKVELDKFDFAALRWDFGDAGREALVKLTRHPDQEIGEMATIIQNQKSRPYRWASRDVGEAERLENLRLDLTDQGVAARVRNLVLYDASLCRNPCVAIDLGTIGNGLRHVALVESGTVSRHAFDMSLPADDRDRSRAEREAVAMEEPRAEQRPGSTVEVREWTGRQIHVDGEPVGRPFK